MSVTPVPASAWETGQPCFAFSVHVPWPDVIVSTFLPALSLDHDFLLTVVAVFGTIISPYLFFWQESQEAEESRLSHRRKYRGSSAKIENYFSHISIDTWVGMFFSDLVGFFIIVTTGATLHAHLRSKYRGWGPVLY